MRFSFAESMCDPSHYPAMAIAAEEAGYTSLTVPDSIVYPRESDANYPYTDDGGREFLEGKPFIEPFVLIPGLAAITERLRFTTFVMKLPIRQPVLVAKQATSIAVMSGNRLGFGVGISPWPEDFTATASPWKGRGRRLDEMIEIVRGLATGDYFEFHGEHFDLPAMKICPAPSEPIPILIGGHSDAALRRAARVGDGWLHAGGAHDDLVAMLERLGSLRKEFGREHLPFEVHALSPLAFTIDGVKQLEDLGVTDCIIAFRDPYQPDALGLQGKLDAMRAFADDVISKL